MINSELTNQLMKNKKPTILLHACCAPCATVAIELMRDDYDITIYFYNPNITEAVEYEARLTAIKELVSLYSIKLIAEEYDTKKFDLISTGLESEPEKGKRCYECYKMRLEKTAIMREEENIFFFATTLTTSPYKNNEWINEIGENLSNKYINTNFKKNNGYQKSIELSKKYKLYRQNYCGCRYSKGRLGK